MDLQWQNLHAINRRRGTNTREAPHLTEPAGCHSKASVRRVGQAMQNEDVASVAGSESAPVPSAIGKGIRLRLVRIVSYLPNLAFLVFLIFAWQFASTVWLPRIDP